MTLAEKFSINLIAERKRKRLSQESLANKASISVSYVSMLEREKRAPTLHTLELIAKALNVSPIKMLQ